MTLFIRTANAAIRETWLWRNRFAFGCDSPGDWPRLLVDVSAIIRRDAQTGIQRVVRAVWSELNRRKGTSFELVPVYATATRGYCYAPCDFIGCSQAELDKQPAGVRPGDRFLGLDLTAHLLPKYQRQLKAWKAHGASIHLLVYDLLPLLRPNWFNKSAVTHFRRWCSVLEEEADQAICISDQVAGELSRRLQQSRLRGPRITRMQVGADIAASMPSTGSHPEVARLLERIRFRPAVLMVGTVEPRKGHDVALSAFEHMWRAYPEEAPDLVIVGKRGWKTKALQARISSHPEQGRRLHWLTGTSDEDLCRLYDASRGVFVPSRAEGLGLPVIEAAASRRYVLARDLPVFREQKLRNVIFFDSDDPEALSKRLRDLVALGKEGPSSTVELPTWRECVDGLLHEIGIPSGNAKPESLLRKAS